MKRSRLFIFLLMVFFLSSCALNNYEIKKPYQPTLENLEHTKSYFVDTEVIFEPVFKEDPRAVGVKKNGYGHETARIYLAQDVKDWLKNALDQELERAGFHAGIKNDSSKIKFILNVQQFFVEPWVGFWSCDIIGSFKTTAIVEFSDKDSYYIRRFVVYDKTTNIIWTDGMYETRIINLAQKIIPEIVRETNKLILAKSN